MSVALPVSVREMRVSDIAAVHRIEQLSFATPWPAYALEQELTTNRMARYVVAEVAGRIVGFAGVWLMVDEAHITTFGVHPDARRQGVGRQMLVELFDLARQIGARRLTLEVRVSNDGAQALYSAFGFGVVGRRPRYYTDDGEDAYVMTTPDLGDPRLEELVRRQRDQLPGMPTEEPA